MQLPRWVFVGHEKRATPPAREHPPARREEVGERRRVHRLADACTKAGARTPGISPTQLEPSCSSGRTPGGSSGATTAESTRQCRKSSSLQRWLAIEPPSSGGAK